MTDADRDPRSPAPNPPAPNPPARDRTTQDPPAQDLTFELLADLHAGALDEQTEAELWPLVRADPAAQAVLAGLDATRTALGALGASADVGAPATPSVRMPTDVAGRLDAALAALGPAPRDRPASPSGARPEAGPPPPGPAPVGDLAAARERRRRRWVPAASIAAAAALIAVVGVGAVVGTRGTDVSGSPQAAGPSPGTPDLGSTLGPQALSAIGRTDFGPLTDPAARAACLQANGIAAGATVLGASEVTLDGRSGVLLLLPGRVPPQLTALVVGPQCSAGNPDAIDRQDLGPR